MLVDPHGRTFKYLRLSLNNSCNFRCSYCLPNGYKNGMIESKNLDLNEIKNLALAFSHLGVEKIRLTGGEPTLREDLVKIIETLKKIQGIKQVTLSTNGFRLKSLTKHLIDAGLDGINISIDSLDRANFQRITKRDFLPSILSGIDSILETKTLKVKVNAVLLRDLNDAEISDFINYVQDKDLSVRFIELMQTKDNQDYFQKHHLSSKFLKDYLSLNGWYPIPRLNLAGPAQEYGHHHSLGRIGIIAPFDQNFCGGCNRLRVNAQGALRLCLFGDGNFDLRPFLQSEFQLSELSSRIKELLNIKPLEHRLIHNDPGSLTSFSSIGG